MSFKCEECGLSFGLSQYNRYNLQSHTLKQPRDYSEHKYKSFILSISHIHCNKY